MFRKIASALLSFVLAGTMVSPAQASNLSGLVPAFGTPVSVAGGFAVQITNYDASFDWSAFASDCALAEVTSDGWVNVTGVASLQTVSVRVETTRSGYDAGSEYVSGSAAGFLSNSYASPAGQNSNASQALASEDGTLFAIWDAYLNQGVQLHKSIDHGQSWTSVETWAAANNSRPSFALGANGRIAAIWRDGSGSNFLVKTSVSIDGGENWTTPSIISSSLGNELMSIGFASDGDIVASWYAYDGTKFRIFVSSSTDSGLTWSAQSYISPVAESGYYPRVIQTQSGSLQVIWSAGDGMRASVYDEVNNSFGAAVLGPNAPSIEAYSYSVVGGAGTTSWLAWLEGSGSRKVMVSSFDGSTWSAATEVASGSVYEPEVAVSQSSLAVIWSSGIQVFGKTSASVTSLNFGATKTISSSGVSLQNLALSTISDSSFIASWLRSASLANGYYVPQYSITSDSGATWASPVTVASPLKNNYQPLSLVAPDGAVTIMWREQGSDVRMKTATVSSTVTIADPRTLYQAAEINPGGANDHSSIYDMEILNGKMYLIARHNDTGFELFEFDGTDIALVEDLWPGTANGAYDTQFVANTGTELFFQGTDGVTGYELYKFDGTSISLAADINPASATPSDSSGNLITAASQPRDGAVLGNKLFFSATYPSSSTGYVLELGNPNAVPQTLSSYFSGFTASGYYSPLVLDNKLYFRAGGAIYQTDGTATPTMVPGTDSRTHFSIGAFGHMLMIGASPTGTNSDVELMMWDPQDPTTAASLVENINTYNTGAAAGSYPVSFVERCNAVYFVASSGFSSVINNREVWKYDGNQVSLAKDFWEGPLATDSGWPQGLHVAGDEIFTFAQSAGAGFEPWLLSGSDFSMIEDFNPGTASSMSGAPPFLTWNNTTYMRLWGPTGLELYAYGVEPQGHQVATFTIDYTITYDANGGTGAATETNAAGNITLNSGSGFSMANKQLLGWDSSSTAVTPTYVLGDSFTLASDVTLYAIWGDVPASPEPAPLPELETPNGPIETAAGGDVEIKGKNLGGVTKAEIDTKEAKIKQKSANSLTLGVPEMNPGLYDLTLTSNLGKLTIQGAVRVTFGVPVITPDAQATIAAWTKINESKTKVRVIVKNPIGAGKVQFLHNGKEIAWVRAADGRDPKLSYANSSSYLVKTVNLSVGRNVFEIMVDGKRFARTCYHLPEAKLKR